MVKCGGIPQSKFGHFQGLCKPSLAGIALGSWCGNIKRRKGWKRKYFVEKLQENFRGILLMIREHSIALFSQYAQEDELDKHTHLWFFQGVRLEPKSLWIFFYHKEKIQQLKFQNFLSTLEGRNLVSHLAAAKKKFGCRKWSGSYLTLGQHDHHLDLAFFVVARLSSFIPTHYAPLDQYNKMALHFWCKLLV